ncbi:hypothetical protein AALP_AAs40209U000200 [Arabis alpina]|uniref:Retrotransposon gag domain-containing protein n=1 Tax=Arabis alpina TaxID=50452 RepID=A0A087G2K7_ARAAL|nr:hypothetical protein AALP_AAs40209U000200 [Arabis alpina]
MRPVSRSSSATTQEEASSLSEFPSTSRQGDRHKLNLLVADRPERFGPCWYLLRLGSRPLPDLSARRLLDQHYVVPHSSCSGSLRGVRSDPNTDSPMEQDPHPRILKITPQAAGGAEVSSPTNPRLQVKTRAEIPIHRDWPVGFNSEPRIPKVEPPSPRAAGQTTITFHHVERVLANWRHRFDTITQGDKTVEEYFQEFMLLKNATKCTQDLHEVLLRFWKGLGTEFHMALGGSIYYTAVRLADDAAKLEKMGRDREPGMFGGLGNLVPAPPTAAARVNQHDTRPADWSYFLDAYRTHADLRINPSPGEEARKGSNGWLEESDDESDIWSEGKPEGKHYWDSPPSATTPTRTQSG